jgi:hypothetical protein
MLSLSQNQFYRQIRKISKLFSGSEATFIIQILKLGEVILSFGALFRKVD